MNRKNEGQNETNNQRKAKNYVCEQSERASRTSNWNRTEPNRTEPNRTEPNRTEPIRTDPIRSERNGTEQNGTEPDRTGSERSKQEKVYHNPRGQALKTVNGEQQAGEQIKQPSSLHKKQPANPRLHAMGARNG